MEHDAGHVRVYQNVSGTWTQVGSDIDGECAGDYSGFSVSLSSDGSMWLLEHLTTTVLEQMLDM